MYRGCDIQKVRGKLSTVKQSYRYVEIYDMWRESAIPLYILRLLSRDGEISPQN